MPADAYLAGELLSSLSTAIVRLWFQCTTNRSLLRAKQLTGAEETDLLECGMTTTRSDT